MSHISGRKLSFLNINVTEQSRLLGYLNILLAPLRVTSGIQVYF